MEWTFLKREHCLRLWNIQKFRNLLYHICIVLRGISWYCNYILHFYKSDVFFAPPIGFWWYTRYNWYNTDVSTLIALEIWKIFWRDFIELFIIKCKGLTTLVFFLTFQKKGLAFGKIPPSYIICNSLARFIRNKSYSCTAKTRCAFESSEWLFLPVSFNGVLSYIVCCQFYCSSFQLL